MTSPSPGDVTLLLLEWNRGNPEARERLIPLVYRELRRRAGNSLRGERGDHTLQPTDLVHEAYLKLVDQRRVRWRDRAHFFAVSSVLMRRILVDHARRRRAQKRGAGAARVSADTAVVPWARDVDLLDLDEALTELTALDPDQGRVVELRFFAGLSIEEAAEATGRSKATVNRDWSMARAWLHQRLAPPRTP
jgi:RNA polymerase sigma factor (TIGR02999 family)